MIGCLFKRLCRKLFFFLEKFGVLIKDESIIINIEFMLLMVEVIFRGRRLFDSILFRWNLVLIIVYMICW